MSIKHTAELEAVEPIAGGQAQAVALEAVPPVDEPAAARSGLAPALYPNQYVWFVFLSTMDLLFTWTILHSGGRELNLLANMVIEFADKYGLIAYKMGFVVAIIFMIEKIGKHKPAVGQRVAEWAVAITSIPVAIGGTLLLADLLV